MQHKAKFSMLAAMSCKDSTAWSLSAVRHDRRLFKRLLIYCGMLFMLVIATSCNEEFDIPPMKSPPPPNMSIAEFKAKYWRDTVNYVDTVQDNDIIHGWITSTDETGNIYNTIYIMDESGVGLPIAVSSRDMYTRYRLGAEVVLEMKGYHVGKITGMMQVGAPYFYKNTNVWETSTMNEDTWKKLGQVNGFPDLSKVDTTEITLDQILGKNDAETLIKYQGLLVRINDVTFENANGITTYSDKNQTVNRRIADSNGKKLNVRMSNYATFGDSILPKSGVDIVGLLGYFATKANPNDPWQIYLRTIDDVIVRPPRPVTWADFETISGHTTNMGTFTTEAGWVATNCMMFEGGDKDANPVFAFIGTATNKLATYAKAPTLNGGTDAVGTVVSPVLNGGMTRLRFSYGYAFSGKQLACRVDVKQNGTVVKSWTVANNDVQTKTAYSFDEECRVEGEFTIEFTNLCPSGKTGKTDRLSIWNINWDIE